jgi:acetoin utilization deacetylase AcuC-like enzyme
MVTFVYSPEYYCDIGQHVFPVLKFRLLYERIKDDPAFAGARFVSPSPASIEDLRLVHTEQYIKDILAFRHTKSTRNSELPISEQIINAYVVGTGGTICAAEAACPGSEKEGSRPAPRVNAGMNLTGGFHHAFSDHAEGFCYVNDIAVAIRKLQREKKIKRAFVVDCDLHQGNGTAHIFRGDPNVFTFSIHQENLYPLKQKSTLDIGLPNHTSDREYLAHLESHVPRIMAEFRPDIVFYLAGADPYEGDQLGSLRLTMKGLQRRDELVFRECKAHGMPVCVVVAGGYAFHTEDTIQIHYNTCCALMNAFGG